VYDLAERINLEFLAGKQPIESATLMRGSLAEPELVFGDAHAWDDFYSFVATHDASNSDVYDEIGRLVAIDNLIDYFILHIFIADNDGPDSNADVFRVSNESPWQFLVWDLDAGFNYRGEFVEHDTLAWNLRDSIRNDLKPYGTADAMQYVESALLLRKLMANDEFRAKFRSRFDYMLETILSTESLMHTFETTMAKYRDAEYVELLRFPNVPKETAADYVGAEIGAIRDFIERRPAVMRRLLDTHLPVNGNSAQ
jgi:spore coat protein CotH